MARSFAVCWTFGWLALVLAVPIVEVRAAEEAPKIDPEAAKLLHRVADAYRAADQMSVQLIATMKVEPINSVSKNVTSLKFARPNKLAAVLDEGETGLTIVSDGEHVTVSFGALNRYSVSEAPESFDELLSPPLQALTMGQGLMFAMPLLTDKPYEALLDGISEIRYVGPADLEQRKLNRVKFVQPSMDLDMWIDAAAEKPVIVRVQPDLTRALAKGAANVPENIKIELTIDFKDWNLAAKLPDDAFAFKAPEGAEKVDSLFGRAEPEPHPLQDKPAPEFDLKLLAGGSARLADHKGKDVVILDFWATWCGPCVQALPTIAEVAAEYKKKGVAFYAVNLEEDADAVREFLKEHKLDVPVALDSDGKVGAAYGAQAIPQTVIIDKQGTVAVVHVGLSPDLKAELSGELDAVLAGKKPGEKTAPTKE
ncbi:MAG TPA: redoxin family protein [Pirellulales bacterium]|jgi:peroxiredoxin|nr:redoxin family protein [Pirellulales bacterium]